VHHCVVAITSAHQLRCNPFSSPMLVFAVKSGDAQRLFLLPDVSLFHHVVCGAFTYRPPKPIPHQPVDQTHTAVIGACKKSLRTCNGLAILGCGRQLLHFFLIQSVSRLQTCFKPQRRLEQKRFLPFVFAVTGQHHGNPRSCLIYVRNLILHAPFLSFFGTSNTPVPVSSSAAKHSLPAPEASAHRKCENPPAHRR